MPNFASTLKQEITRLAKKEVKSQSAILKRSSAQYRRDIAQLKREIQAMEKKIAYLASREAGRLGQSGAESDDVSNIRFSARSVRAQRKRLDLSAGDYGKLVGVSAQTIYMWESGKSRPRQSQLAALVAIRGLGKREASTRLETFSASNSRPKSAKKKRRRTNK